ncbi:MAG: hypothetical protein AAFX79_09400 [Planctomycetota bacterium]
MPGRIRISSLRRWLVLGALVVVAVLTAAVMVSISLAHQAPKWWRTVRADDPRTVQTAVAIENSLWNALYKPREGEDGPWHVWVRAPDANAWINTKMREWVASRWELEEWPQELGEIQVEFVNDELAIGVRLMMPDGERFVWAVVEPIVDDDGALWLPARSVSLGRLTLPAGVLLAHARQNSEDYVPPALRDLPETEALLRALEGREPLLTSAEQALGDGRRVELVAVRCVGGRLEMWCRTHATPALASTDGPRDDGVRGVGSREPPGS